MWRPSLNSPSVGSLMAILGPPMFMSSWPGHDIIPPAMRYNDYRMALTCNPAYENQFNTADPGMSLAGDFLIVLSDQMWDTSDEFVPQKWSGFHHYDHLDQFKR